MDWIEWIWLGLMVVFLVAEGVCAFHLVSIWFAAGALAAMLAGLLGAELWLQVTVFLVVSCALLAALWPLTRRYLQPKVEATNVDAVIGSVGVVTHPIDNLNAQGSVKLGAMEWTARSADGRLIAAGTQVRVDRIEGVKAFVTPVKEKTIEKQEVLPS